MTIRQYVEEMGLQIAAEIAPEGFRCSIAGVCLSDSCGKPAAATDGPTVEESLARLSSLISHRILQDSRRETSLYWVPALKI